MATSSAIDQPAKSYRGIVTVCVMLATLMQSLDTTIANVALPYMQGSLHLGADLVYRGGRDHDRAGRVVVGAHWAEDAVPRLPRRLHSRIHVVWLRRVPQSNGAAAAGAC